MSNPEIAERLQDPAFTRLAEAELPQLIRDKNAWGTVSFQFADGSEALDLFMLRSRVIDYGLPISDPSLDRELFPETSTIAMLDHQLVAHIIPRSFLFESKVELFDQEADQKKEFRTKSLLDDLNFYFANLGYMDTWFKVHPRVDDSITLAAQLVGFTLYGEGEQTAVEPIVMGTDGTVGLLPENVYIDPYLSLRVKS